MSALRGHHLICLHFYSGEGYEEPFIRNLENVLVTVAREGVRIVEGADDVCVLCPYRQKDRCTQSPAADREVRIMDRRALDLLEVEVGERVAWDRLRKRAHAVFPSWYRHYCFACSWRSVCERDNLFRKLKEAALRR